MKREIVLTQDGSSSIYLPEWDESYHSKHGAIQEAYHVFIKNGLDCVLQNEISILEIGFGTGLNALITLHEAQKRNVHINYHGIEAYPVEQEIINQLNYISQLQHEYLRPLFFKMHNIPWEIPHDITSNFKLTKRQLFFEKLEDVAQFDLIYFDAFGYRVQPELWQQHIFENMYRALKPNGLLTTYACRTVIRKAMEQAGFETQKKSGAPGKREMLVALKK